MRQTQQLDGELAGGSIAQPLAKVFEGETVGVPRKELIAIHQVQQRHRLATQSMDHMSVVNGTVARLNLKLLQFSTGRVFGPHEGFEFGAHKTQLPCLVGKDVLQFIGEFVRFDDDDQIASERTDNNHT